jgi:hypothetical protein
MTYVQFFMGCRRSLTLKVSKVWLIAFFDRLEKALRDLTSWLGGETQAQCILNAAQDAERQLSVSWRPIFG